MLFLKRKSAGASRGFSLAIEALQYAFMLGRCETDDVIINIMGAFTGTSTYPIAVALERQIEKRRKKKEIYE